MAKKMLIAEKRPDLFRFTMPLTALLAAMFGFVGGNMVAQPMLGMLIGALVGAAIAFVADTNLNRRTAVRWGTIAALAIAGLVFGNVGTAVSGAIIGAVLSWTAYWLATGAYGMTVPIYYTSGQTLWHNTFKFICGLIFFFLVAPLIPVMWLSFNAEDFFTFTPEMLNFQAEGYSLKHYRDFLGTDEWMVPLKNSLIIAPIATIISVTLGTLAAIGLSQSHVPGRQAIMAILISPMIVPLIISATGMFFFYAPLGNWLEATLGLSQSFVGFVKVILAHAVLGIPFVIITVTATLVGFDRSLTRAAASMGANPVTTFFQVQMPLILPGVISGGLFAFITSFDEVVVVLFVGSAQQQTLPWQMFTGLREQISPTILAAATILVIVSIMLLTTVELLRRRSERLRGLSPA
ncbi:putative spermidine/putrescine transport system permease protein [Yoonia rosea]|uniref:Putative spermidine/putrescine transport system permease protein n=1 Tax=Yoonia rosea TaxID=287098 RepID=A0A1R3XDA6_9RHOB|nr:ABC transporter permease [Yoonia rosea]SIT87831.1 putative spermidine/putrescine transport system permease protein [Yoonia rosea]